MLFIDIPTTELGITTTELDIKTTKLSIPTTEEDKPSSDTPSSRIPIYANVKIDYADANPKANV